MFHITAVEWRALREDLEFRDWLSAAVTVCIVLIAPALDILSWPARIIDRVFGPF